MSAINHLGKSFNNENDTTIVTTWDTWKSVNIDVIF